MEDILLTEEPVSNVSFLDLVNLSFTQMILFILITIKIVFVKTEKGGKGKVIKKRTTGRGGKVVFAFVLLFYD